MGAQQSPPSTPRCAAHPTPPPPKINSAVTKMRLIFPKFSGWFFFFFFFISLRLLRPAHRGRSRHAQPAHKTQQTLQVVVVVVVVGWREQDGSHIHCTFLQCAARQSGPERRWSDSDRVMRDVNLSSASIWSREKKQAAHYFPKDFFFFFFFKNTKEYDGDNSFSPERTECVNSSPTP